ncbi:MAG: thymidine kinase [Halanaerobiales bacterium]
MYKYNGGHIELIIGPMFAGKTTELIRRLTRAQYAGQKIIVFKPVIDDRYSESHVVSHNGEKIYSIVTNDFNDIMNISKDYDVIAIDEIQFFPSHGPVVENEQELILGINELLNKLADKGKEIIVTGLDMDFKCEPFTNTMLIAGIAEKIDKLTAICINCGAPATRSQRLVNGKPAYSTDPSIIIGGKESYEARCRKCHKILFK